MQQLPLAISPRIEPAFDNFVAGPNAEALARVRALAAETLGERIVYLWGEAGCGRSHLLRAAARANRALVIADDVQALGEAEQQALFVAINDAREGGPAVLASGDLPPALLALRADLKSLLAWGLVYQLKPLSDGQKAEHLKAAAGRRGLALSEEVVAYLLTRLPRDLYSLNALLDRLDRHSLARRRPLTVPLVREVLQSNNAPAGGSRK